MGQRASSQQTNSNPNEDAAWWCKLLARIIGCIGGFMCLISSFWTMLTLTQPLCILAGVLMLVGGFIVLVFEASICFSLVEFTQPIRDFADRRSFLQKGLLYAVIAIPPFAMCAGLSSLFGCGLVFAAGVFYGLMGLGRKADREQMIQNAQGDQMSTQDPEANLVSSEAKPQENPFGQR